MSDDKEPEIIITLHLAQAAELTRALLHYRQIAQKDYMAGVKAWNQGSRPHSPYLGVKPIHPDSTPPKFSKVLRAIHHAVHEQLPERERRHWDEDFPLHPADATG